MDTRGLEGQDTQGRPERLTEKACKNCHMISAGPVCPNCKQTNLSEEWTGLVVILDPSNSQVAALMGIKVPGRFAIRVR